MGQMPSDFPPVVYVPCLRRDSDDEPHVVLRRTRDARVALFVYSALDRLRDGIGDDTPWVLVTVEGLEAIRRETPYDLVLLDVHVPEDKRLGAWA